MWTSFDVIWRRKVIIQLTIPVVLWRKSLTKVYKTVFAKLQEHYKKPKTKS